MKIHYDVSVSDLVAFNAHVIKKGRWQVFAITFLSIVFLYNIVANGVMIGVINTVILALGLLSVPYAISRPARTGAIVFGGIAILLCLFFITGSSAKDVISTLPALVPLMALYLLGSGFNKYIATHYGGKTDMTGAHSLEVSSDGLTETTPLSTTSYKWDAVSSVEEDKHNVYVFLGRLKAYVIPLASFKSQTDKEEFLKEVARLKSTNATS